MSVRSISPDDPRNLCDEHYLNQIGYEPSVALRLDSLCNAFLIRMPLSWNHFLVRMPFFRKETRITMTVRRLSDRVSTF